MISKPVEITILILLTAFFVHGCSLVESSDDIIRDQIGTLSWGVTPAADGAGILFETEEETYGAPGNKEDYTDHFPKNESRVQIVADIKLTGEQTVRGWGAEFPEIEFIEIKRAE